MLGIFFLIGLVIGSFINALIYRLPRRLGINGRSMCPSCKSQIEWYDLIPLLSYIFLRGRCRKCSKGISVTYPFVELLTGLIFYQFASSVEMVTGNFLFLGVGLFILACFIALLFIDLKYYILPDPLVLSIIFATVAYLVLNPLGVEKNILGAVLWGGLFGFVYWVSKGKWMGFGDVKLAAAIGLFFGMLDGFFVVYLAVIAGALVGIVLLITKKAGMKSKIPFGSFLAGASIIFILFGKIIYSAVNIFI